MLTCWSTISKTIILGVVIGAVAHVIMIGGAAPSLLKAGKGVAPFIVSFFTLAIGAGIFKPNVAPIVVDQYKDQRQIVKTLKSGEKVIVDPETTIQRVFLILLRNMLASGYLSSCRVLSISCCHSSC